MERDEVLRLLAVHRRDLARFGVRSLAVFGSTARDEAKPGSDVDFLIEFDGQTTFDRYMDVKLFLEDLLGRRVDLVTRKALRASLRRSIEADAIDVVHAA